MTPARRRTARTRAEACSYLTATPPAQASPPPAAANCRCSRPSPRAILGSKYATQARQFEKEARPCRSRSSSSSSAAMHRSRRRCNVGGAKIWFVPINYRGRAVLSVFWGDTAAQDAGRARNERTFPLRSAAASRACCQPRRRALATLARGGAMRPRHRRQQPPRARSGCDSRAGRVEAQL